MILEQWAPREGKAFYENLKLSIGKLNLTAQKGLKVKFQDKAKIKKKYWDKTVLQNTKGYKI